MALVMPKMNIASSGRKKQAMQIYGQVVEGYAARGFLLKGIAVCKVMLQLDAKNDEAQRRLAQLCAQQEASKPQFALGDVLADLGKQAGPPPPPWSSPR